MRKHDFIYNIPDYKIKNNFEYGDKNIKIIENNLIIEKNIKNINKEYLLKDDNTNLSDVLSAIRRARAGSTSQTRRVITQNPLPRSTGSNNIPQMQQPQTTQSSQSTNQQQTTPQTSSIRPKTITNTNQLWSPVSGAGVIYKYNRGVIGIEIDGTKHEIIFDGTFRHHNEATAEIGIKTNCPVTDKYANPFLNGMEVSKQGTIIIQLEGDSILVYLPEMISNEQYIALESEVNPRSNFSTVAFSHGDDIYDDQNVNIQYLRNFYSNIVGVARRASR